MKKHNGRNAIVITGVVEGSQQEICRNVIMQFCSCVENAVVIDFYKGNKLKNIVGDNCDFVKYNFCKDNWADEEDSINRFLEKSGIESLFVFKVRIITGLKINNCTIAKRFISKYKGDKHVYRSYQTTKKICERLLFVNCCYNNNIKLFQFVIDPIEHDFSFIEKNAVKRVYILAKDKMKYCPMYELELSNTAYSSEKLYDMFFICTCFGDLREGLFETFSNVQIENDHMLFRLVNSDNSRRDRISQTEYYENISKSKYTLIVQSYDSTTFSIIRFFEAVCRDCVPLIWYEVCLDDLKNTFEDIYDLVLKYNLIVSSKEEVIDRVKNYENDIQFIDEVKSSKSFRKITDKKKVAKFYKKLLSK